MNKPTRTDTIKGSVFTTGRKNDAPASYSRGDFFRDLEKVAKKQDRPSQHGQEKR